MIKKIIIAVVALVVLILGAAVLLPIIYKDRLVEIAKVEINKNVNAEINFGDFDLSLFKSFPNFSFTINDFSVKGIDRFQGITLADIGEFSFTVDLMSIIGGGTIKVKAVELDKMKIHVLILKDGTANYDIAKVGEEEAPEETEATEFSVKLKKFSIRNSSLIYDDRSSDMKAIIVGLNHTSRGDFTQDNFVLGTKTHMDQLTYIMEGINYLHKVRTDIKADLAIDQVNSKYTFQDNEFQLNQLILGLDGYVAMPGDDIEMDLSYSAKKTSFLNILSLVPAVFKSDFDDLKTSGKLALDGTAKGTLSETTIPAFTLNLIVEDGMFQYPDVPTSVNNVQINLKVNNPDGVPDHTVVNLSKFHIELDKAPFDMTLVLKTPESDPDIDMKLNGRIDLAELAKTVPVEGLTTLTGIIKMDLEARGRLSVIDRGQYDKFHTAGSFEISDFVYESEDLPQKMSISEMLLTFNPRDVTLNKFVSQIGASDIRASGSISNMFGYMFNDGTLKGSLSISSKLFDSNEWIPEEEEGASEGEEEPLEIIEVPSNIDFVMNASADKVLYEDLEMRNVKGTLIIRNSAIKLLNMGGNTLDGNMVMNGTYSTVNPGNPDFDFDYKLKGMDIKKSYNAFSTAESLAPVGKYLDGKFNSNLSIKGKLLPDMMPDLNTLTGNGNTAMLNGKLSGFPALDKVADALKMKELSTLDVQDVTVFFTFKDGRVFVEPFEVKKGDINMTISGSHGFDETIDYVINTAIPSSYLGSAANEAKNALVGLVKDKGFNIDDMNEINVKINITGTVEKPIVKTGMGKGAKSAGTSAKDQLKDELDKKKKEAEAKVRAEAERLKQEADKKRREAQAKAQQEIQKRKADALKKKKDAEAKAKAEALKKKKAAEAKAKAEAERLKKEAEAKAKKEAEDRLKKLNPFKK